MRKLLVSLVAAGTALTVATPAAAQYWPQPAYNQGYGYNQYGYRGDNIAALQQDLQQIRVKADMLQRQGRLDPRESRDLYRDIWSVQRSLNQSGRYGVQPWQAQRLRQRVVELRYELQRYSDYDGRNGNRYGRYDQYGRRY